MKNVVGRDINTTINNYYQISAFILLFFLIIVFSFIGINALIVLRIEKANIDLNSAGDSFGTEKTNTDLNSVGDSPQVQGNIALATTAYGFTEIVLLNVSGGKEKVSRLTYSNNPDPNSDQPGIYNWAPALSPDSSVVAYVSKRDGQTEIYAIASTGDGKPVKLTDRMSPADHPTWSSDGQKIYFASEKSGSWQIYAMSLKSDFEEQNAQTLLKNLSISKDMISVGITEQVSIQQVTQDDDVNNTYPTLSPNDDKIAFISDRAGSNGLYILDLTTNEITPLVTSIDNLWSPSWSPDGKKILFVSDEDERDYMGTIYIVDLDNNNSIAPFIMLDDSYVGYPDWSPDNQYIAFSLANKEGSGRRATYLHFASSNGYLYLNKKVGNLEAVDRTKDEAINIWGASWSYGFIN